MKLNKILYPILLFPLFYLNLAGCITTDENGREINMEEEPILPSVPTRWIIENIPVQPSWTREDYSIPIIYAGLPANTPEVIALSDLPPVGDQGAQASGTAWALRSAVSFIYRNKRHQVGFLCSPAFIYNQLNEGKDEGIEISDALQLLQSAGCPREEYMPYKANDTQHRPSGQATMDAQNHRISGYGRVDFTDLSQIKSHLIQGSMIIVTMRIAKNFLNLKEPIWEKPDGEPVGRHTMVVVGYDSRNGYITLMNSAGPSWGAYGLCRMPYQWFIRLTGQAYIIW